MSTEPSVNERISALENEVKRDIVEHGASVKASKLHAVYTRPRISWDTKGLDGYAVARPEILAFRKEGKPSISIRVAK